MASVSESTRGKNPPTAAVLTGDVVRSSEAGKAALRRLPGLLRGAGKAAADILPDAGVSGIDIFRGDSWQIFVRDPSAALHAALLVRSFLLGGGARGEPAWDTRVAFGFGTVDRLDKRKVSRSQGAAFAASGAALDSLADSRARMAVAADEPGEPRAGTFARANVLLLDALVQNWTSKQAWAVHGAIRGQIQSDIGASFRPPVAQSTVVRHLHSARWDVLETILGVWRDPQPPDDSAQNT
ncbi:MAG: hypothetical protein JJU00_17700 [Opitutales bacterium]|nr:hypothetical protein [Opitutales bacterium]